MQSISPLRSRVYSVALVTILILLPFSALFVSADMEILNPAVLVQDINTASGSANPSDLRVVGNQLLFTANDGINGNQLWATEGTATGVFRLKAIEPTSPIAISNGTGFFAARDQEHGVELWRTDGTAAGTQLVKDIFPGPQGSYPYELVDHNGTLFFVAYDTVDENGYFPLSLWKSDGTAAGTVPVVDPLSQPLGTPRLLTSVNNKLFFIVDGTTVQLWVSDGTAAGTQVVKSFIPASTVAAKTEPARQAAPRIPIDPPYDYQLTAFGNTLFFRANDEAHGVELWRSDGTAAGTTLVKDLNPGTAFSSPGGFTVFQEMLFFTAVGGLWKSDGTAAGTVIVHSGLGAAEMTSLGNQLFIAGIDAEHGQELWLSDGTTAGTQLLKDIQPGPKWSSVSGLTVFNGTLFFGADDGVHGWELWQSDGTGAGTTLVKDLIPGPDSGAPTYLTARSDRLFFQAYDDQHGAELWSSDGTATGTGLVTDLNRQPEGSYPADFTAVGAYTFFTAQNSQGIRHLWRSNGTSEGTQPIEAIGPLSSMMTQVIDTNLYMVPNNGTLWRIDGVSGTPQLLKETPNGQITALAALDNHIFFLLSSTDAQESGLWQSDGTAAGTQLIKALQPGAEMLTINHLLYFPAYATEFGTEVWVSDGTTAGTRLLKDINPSTGDAAPARFTDVSGTLFFLANDGSHGWELWKSDGTADGTRLVKDIYPGAGSSALDWSVAIDGRLFFVSIDSPPINYEVWVSDGTEAGTHLLKDIQPAQGPTVQPSWLTEINGKLLFVANDVTTNGEELWISDGTTAGTQLLKDINPGPAGAAPSALTNVNGVVLFAATDSTGQRTLWRSAGTTASTQPLQNITPAPNWYHQQSPAFIAAGANIFFSADNGATGQELWRLPILANEPQLKTPTLVGAPSSGVGRIPIEYGNQSNSVQTAITLTAVLHEALTYLDSSGPVTPTLTGHMLVWQLPAAGFLEGGEIDLRVQTPAAPLGTRYPVTLTLSIDTAAAVPNQTTVTVDVMIADQNYLPIIKQ